MIYAAAPSEWIDEDHAVEHYPITSGNHAAEANAHRFTDTGGCAIVLRCGFFYGRGAAHSEQIWRWPDSTSGSFPANVTGTSPRSTSWMPPLPPWKRYIGQAGVFHVADDEPVTKHLHAACAQAVNTRLWVKVPGRMGLLLGDKLTSLTRSLRIDNGRFRSSHRLEAAIPQRPRRLPRDGLSNCSSLRRWRDLD